MNVNTRYDGRDVSGLMELLKRPVPILFFAGGTRQLRQAQFHSYIGFFTSPKEPQPNRPPEPKSSITAIAKSHFVCLSVTLVI